MFQFYIKVSLIILLGTSEIATALTAKGCVTQKNVATCDDKSQILVIDSAFIGCDVITSLCPSNRQTNRSDVTNNVKKVCNCKRNCLLTDRYVGAPSVCRARKTFLVLNYRCANRSTSECMSPIVNKPSILTSSKTSDNKINSKSPSSPPTTGPAGNPIRTTTKLPKTTRSSIKKLTTTSNANHDLSTSQGQTVTNAQKLSEDKIIWIGVGLGIALVIALLLGAALYLYKSRKGKKPDNSLNNNKKSETSDKHEQEIQDDPENQYYNNPKTFVRELSVIYENVPHSSSNEYEAVQYQNTEINEPAVYENCPPVSVPEAEYNNDVELPVTNPERPYVVLD